MASNTNVGLALLGGYALGRAKKAKAAIAVGLWLTGRKISLDPQRISKAIADSPLVGGIRDRAGKELLEAGKSAAGTVVTARANRLADSIHERTLSLQEREPAAEEEEEPEEERDEERDEEPEEKPEEKRKAGGKRRTSSRTGTRRSEDG